MRKFVPDFIAENYENGKYSGLLHCVTLFADISGFTSSAEELSKHGKEGSEVLSDMIHVLFEKTAEIIRSRNGFVTKYIGDAFISFFPHDNTPESEKAAFINAVSAGFELGRYFLKNGEIDTKFGNFFFGLKIGIGTGVNNWKIIGRNNIRTYYFEGKSLWSATSAEKKIRPGEIAVSSSVCEKYSDLINAVPSGRSGYSKLVSIRNSSAGSACCIDYGFKDPQLNAIFAGKEETMLSHGEFRNVVTVYISVLSAEDISSIYNGCVDIAAATGGGRPSIFFGDKGLNILLFFGAPVSNGDLKRRALDFISEFFRRHSGSVMLRAGITEGVLYSGYTGSDTLREFTCFGLKINLAARMMTGAGLGEILADNSIASQKGYAFTGPHEMKFKGFKGKIGVYRLSGRSLKNIPAHNEKIYGRDKEHLLLSGFISPILEGRNAGTIIVTGQEGIGKSVLIRSVERSMSEKVKWIYMNPANISGQNLSPVISGLQSVFALTDMSASEAVDNFNLKFNGFLSGCSNKSLAEETEEGRSYIAGLLDIIIKNSVFSKIKGKLRRDNFISASRSFFKCISLNYPVVLVFEDSQWMDSDTEELIRQLGINSDDFPFAIILLERTFEGRETVSRHPGSKTLKLEKLGCGPVRSIMSEIFSVPENDIPDDLVDTVLNKTSGNPFFTGQLSLYLRENNLLDPGMKLRDKDIELPSEITSAITARIDSLASGIRDLIKTASVLGTEINLNILSLMSEGKEIREETDTAIKEDIWYPVDSMICLFRHSMIRDTAYGMILKKKLRELHRSAAEAIESNFKNSSSQFCHILSDHYYRAQMYNKAFKYAKLSIIKAKKNYDTAVQEQYLLRSLEIVQLLNISSEKKYKLEKSLLLDVEHLYHFTSQADKQKLTLKKLQRLFRSSKDPDLKVQILLVQYKMQITVGRAISALRYASKALKIASSNGIENAKALAEYSIGNTYMRAGSYIKCRKFVENALAKYIKIGDKKGLSMCYNSLGLITTEENKWNESLQYYKKQIDISRKLNDFEGITASYNNIAIVHYKRRNYKEAKKFFMKVLRLSKKINNKSAYSTAAINLGVLEYLSGRFEKALEFYSIKLNISEELGDLRGMMNANNNIASILFEKGQYSVTIPYFMKNIELSEKLGLNNQTARAAYNLGQTYGVLGNFNDSLLYLKKAQDLYKKDKDEIQQAKIAHYMGILYQKNGDLINSDKMYSEAVSIMKDKNDENTLGDYILGYCDILFERNKYEKFKEFFSFISDKEFADEKYILHIFNSMRYEVISNGKGYTEVYNTFKNRIKAVKNKYHKGFIYYKLVSFFKDDPVYRRAFAAKSLKLLTSDEKKAESYDKKKMISDLKGVLNVSEKIIEKNPLT